ncbi:MAG: ATP-dependent helicase HrpB [Cytophagales bacterium]|nr:ATP-dependent helicase HrpB [Cytophagales bacterium]
MAFNIQSVDLPIVKAVPQVLETLRQHATLVLKAPPGAGKSTLLPLALLEEEWLQGKKIYMLEPRRLAAKTIAMRMASLLGEEAGQTVGYRIRFESRVGPNTRIEVLTEGILTRMLHQDNSLEDAGIVLFDEFHERSLHADLALALCRESQQILRDDLRILIMSATLSLPELSQKLHAPILESKGKQYPVAVHYEGDADPFLLPELVCSTVVKATKAHQGDVLVFLPGQGEIKACEGLLKKQLPDCAIHPLYGQLPPQKQFAAIVPNKAGKRKIVLATSIAETSLTIQGVTVVVDSGYGRVSLFDPCSGLSRLETIRITQDAAEQRAGRAGRLEAGNCYRLWTRGTRERLFEHRQPEIEQTDLSSLVLELSAWGIENAYDLFWLTPPPNGALEQAKNTLEQLEALEEGKITEEGRSIHKLPCHPRIAHMLLKAKKMNLVGLAADLAAMLESRDPLPKDTGTDINLRIEAMRRFRRENQKHKRLAHIEKIAASYRRLLQAEEDNGLFDEFETGLLLAYAFPERIACARPGNSAQFQLANGKIARLDHRDDLAHESWLSVAQIDARSGMGKIFMASPLNPKDLAPMVKEKEQILWDSEEGGIVASKTLGIGSIALKSTPLTNPDPEKVIQAVLEAVKKEGRQLLDFNPKTTQLQNRIQCMKTWHPEEEWPNMNTEYLLEEAPKWLSPYLSGIRKTSQLHKLDLHQILLHSLSWEQQQLLEERTPETIQVPSGSRIRIEYQAGGEPPVLSVRLQEVFGWLDTPRINQNQTPLLLHLLSPGFKPVQVTTDLKSFWNAAYFEVKKELKRRYPKHSWPNNPLEAEAVRGVKRKKTS